MSDATRALLDLPVVFSHKFRSSFTTETTNLFSSSTDIHPEIDPRAQQSLFNISKLNLTEFFFSEVNLSNLF